jgi:formylglycine-generating enzyme required for sulfatase activity
MGKYPITKAQYKAVMGNDPSSHSYPNPTPNVIAQYHNQTKKHPVECVNWNMAKEFCQKLSKLTGKNYQLPTESQWEYACRAGTTTKYFFGEKHQYIKKYGLIQNHQHLFFVDKRNRYFCESFSARLWQ